VAEPAELGDRRFPAGHEEPAAASAEEQDMEIGEVSPVDDDAERHGDDGTGGGGHGEPVGPAKRGGKSGEDQWIPGRTTPAMAIPTRSPQ